MQSCNVGAMAFLCKVRLAKMFTWLHDHHHHVGQYILVYIKVNQIPVVRVEQLSAMKHL